MKSIVAGWLLLCAVACTLMAAPAMAQPGFGAYDEGQVWRDADWWHTNNPEWMYSNHPEWVVERRDWWWYDHQYHPDWFWAPFWGLYPLWTWGAPYEGVYHDYWWWHQYHPDWMYANHPEWAEPYGGWMRADYGRHPGWFASNYWRNHPRDWGHPDREFWHREDGRFKSYLDVHPERREHGGPRGQEHLGGARGPEHAASMRGPERGVHPAERPSGGGHPNEASRGATRNAPHEAPHAEHHEGGAERGTNRGAGHPNQASRGATHNAPHEASHAEHHEGGGAKGGGREKK
jgi:hypothetical protein